MAARLITRLPTESHAEFWAHFLRFGSWRGTPIENLAGQRFGRWQVTGLEYWNDRGTFWAMACDCGTMAIRGYRNLLKGTSQSCGCKAAEDQTIHGMAGTRPYRIWAGMIGRCRNPSDDNFPRYGGRGIQVHETWVGFEAFWLDMRRGYRDDLTLERIDVNGNYEPGNCCWIPKSEQPQNLRRTVRIRTPGGVMTLTRASERYGINRHTLRGRIRYGWPEWRLLEGYC